MDVKDTNPKDSIGVKKSSTHFIPLPSLHELGLAFLEGALKYGSHNWRIKGVRSSVYYDAFQRHVNSWWEGEDVDPESNLPHLVKAMACLFILNDARQLDKLVDDRPPPHKVGWQQELNAKAALLIDKYPEPKKAYTKMEVLGGGPNGLGS